MPETVNGLPSIKYEAFNIVPNVIIELPILES